MDFSDITLRRHYDSDQDDLLEAFYRPLLETALRYDRAVGYFSEAALKSCAAELADFIERDGHIRIVVGFFTSKKELAALTAEERTLQERKLIRLALLHSLRSLEKTDLKALTIIGSLVASGIVEIRFAVRDDGIFHAKYGILTDSAENKVAFIGSVNETEPAMAPGRNHESFSVYQSNEPEIYRLYGEELEARFDDLWNGKTNVTRVYGVDKETLEFIKTRYSGRGEGHTNVGELPPLPMQYSLRPYQKEALEKWTENGYRGMLSMATGSGKTIVAVDAVNNFKRVLPFGGVVITVPYQNLALQWMRALREHGHEVLPIFGNSADWRGPARNVILAAQLGPTRLPAFICVNNSFKSEEFQELLELLSRTSESRHLVIVDECHHFNSPEHVQKLPGFFKLRLGLSATPYDQFSEHFLDAYFNKVVFEFSLSKAIEAGVLTPYRYHVLTARLSEEETNEYEEITKKIIRLIGGDEVITPSMLSKVQPLLLNRARIVGACVDKLHVLEPFLKTLGRKKYTLFYCGDGTVDEGGESMRQVEAVSVLLHRIGWTSARITADEPLMVRDDLLRKLSEGSLDAVVSIRVLDEGIDIPVCQTALILASQSSDRQGIQRRGRILRRASGKDSADLYDFVVIGGASSSKSMVNLARRELRRAESFASDALNRDIINAQIERLSVENGISRGADNG